MKRTAVTPAFRPLYEQIKRLLTQSLEAGEWKPGEAIPSELELASRYRVSQGTVRKAIDELALENILVRRQGKGTFVASHAEPAYQYRFLRLLPDSGEKAHPKNLFFGLERGKAGGEPARALRLAPGTAVVTFRRVMSFFSRPIVLDEIVFAADQFPGLTLAELEEFHGSVYSFYETVFGVRMIRAEEKIRAVAADAAAAELLGVAVGAPLLSVERLSLTYDDKPVELRRGLYNTTSHHYRNELS